MRQWGSGLARRFFLSERSDPDGENYLLLEDGTPAHTAFVNYAKHPENKFNVLMVATTPRLVAGDPIPSGGIEVRMVPIVTLLNR